MFPAVTHADMDRLIKTFEDYLREERMRGRSTTKRYVAVLGDFERFLARRAPAVPLESVEKAHLVDFLRSGAASPSAGGEPSRSLWNLRLAALRSFYGFLLTMEVIDVNPALKIDRKKTNPREPVPLSLDELLSLAEAAERSGPSVRARNVAIVQLLFHSALRVAELVSLDLDQVDLDNHLFLDVRTKGAKRLSLPFPDIVADALERYLADPRRVPENTDEPALFLSGRGRRMSVRAVQEMIHGYAERAAISRAVTPHLLRHSGATELAELGTPIEVVQEICGHASVTTTRRYVHVRSAARRRAVDALGARVERLAKQRAAKSGAKPA